MYGMVMHGMVMDARLVMYTVWDGVHTGLVMYGMVK